MASNTGRLYTGTPSTGNQLTYTVQSGYYSVFNVSFTNTGGVPATVKLAISTSGSAPSTSEFIEFATTVGANGGVFERTGLVASANNAPYIWVNCSPATVNVNIYGIETSLT
jgi:hypothetical protein